MAGPLKKYDTILLECQDGIYRLILNKPDKLNTLTEQMCSELLDAFRSVEKDPSAKVLLIMANGRAFSAGGDMTQLFLKMIDDRHSGKRPFDISVWLSNASQALRNLPVPTIAVMHGAAIGFGVTLCLQCDLRIAADDSVMGLPFVKLGLIPEFGCTYALPRLVGLPKAFELIYTGKNIKANEAREIGLVNMVVPAAELDSAAMTLAQNIAEGAPMGVRRAKAALNAGLNADLPTQLKLETRGMKETLVSKDHEEAVRAFLAKRKPTFKGK